MCVILEITQAFPHFVCSISWNLCWKVHVRRLCTDENGFWCGNSGNSMSCCCLQITLFSPGIVPIWLSCSSLECGQSSSAVTGHTKKQGEFQLCFLISCLHFTSEKAAQRARTDQDLFNGKDGKSNTTLVTTESVPKEKQPKHMRKKAQLGGTH